MPDQDPKEKRGGRVAQSLQVQERGPEVISPLERIKTEYRAVIDLRDSLYEDDVEEARASDPKKARFLEGQLGVLKPHNDIVLDYGVQIVDKEAALAFGVKLIEELNLTSEQRTAAILAIILHDSGKLNSGLTEHHISGAERAGDILAQVSDLKFEGVEITPGLVRKVKEAILRHMNHPFLVQVIMKGERFPEPEDDIDKIVFDADMLANVGFKNVGFRLNSADFLAQDAAAAEAKGIPALQEAFSNVMEGAIGVRGLKEVVLLEQSRQIIETTIGEVDKVYLYLADQGIFQEVQDEFSQDGQFNLQSIQAKGGLQIIQKRLNEEIFKAASALEINPKLIEKIRI